MKTKGFGPTALPGDGFKFKTLYFDSGFTCKTSRKRGGGTKIRRHPSCVFSDSAFVSRTSDPHQRHSASPGCRHVRAHTAQPGKACELRNNCPGFQSWHAGFKMKRRHGCSSQMGRYWACPQRSHAHCRVRSQENSGV